jgi:AcrR family transcriptional regulator
MPTRIAKTSPAPPSARRSGAPARPVGRPRSTSADQAILDAALALLSEVGVNGLTVSAVVERSGVARATVYRRFPTREALAASVLARLKGRDPFPLSGDIATDIARGVQQAAAVLSASDFRRYLPLFVAEALKGPAAARAQIERVAPNHGHVAREYGAIAAAAGFRTDIDAMLVGDIVMGAMLFRLLSTGRPPDKEAQRQLVAVLERGLRVDEADAEGAA